MCKENEVKLILDLLKKYGYHSQSYNILRSDKSYFYPSSGIEGVIAYIAKANIAMAAGAPICDLFDIRKILTDLINSAKNKNTVAASSLSQSVTKMFYKI